MRPRLLAVSFLASILCPCLLAQRSSICGEKLKSVPANEWVMLYESKTGSRSSPAWYYDPDVKKFILTGGANSWPLHWDTEEFDPSSGKMSNAYPQGVPAGQCTPAAGPSKYADMPRRGYPRTTPWWKDKNGLWRIPQFRGYGDSSQAYYQFAYDAAGKRLILYCRNQTFAYDPKARKWSDTGAGAFAKGCPMHWGSLCYDPVNREIVSVGGTSFGPGGTPGTWVFKCATNKWEKPELGSKSLRNLNRMVAGKKATAWTLMSALRNRLHLTETEAEAKAKISDRAAELLATLEKLTGAFGEARVEKYETAQVKRALGKLEAAKRALGTLKGKVDGKVTPELIAEAKVVHDLLEKCDRNLDFEPTGRALSQMCFDAKNEVIVLFGGDGLDRQYADTWVYHCKERRWEQRWPKKSPSPRAGHALLYLPKSKAVWLGGGFTVGSGHSYMYRDAYWHLPWEAWTYDVKANEWKCVFQVPFPKIPRGHGPGALKPPKGWPWGSYRNAWTMAVSPDDVVLFVKSVGRKGRREVWAMKPDVSVASAALAGKHGVDPETIAVRGDSVHGRKISYDPAYYDRDVKIDRKKTEAFYKSLPVNRWIHINPPKRVDHCGWGTTTYDPDREQFLHWGGGHSEYKGTNVFHYSTRSGNWSSSYNPGWVLEWSSGFLLRVEKSFRDRPHIPVHAYQIYAYDPPSGKMLVASRSWSSVPNQYYTYDVAKREFDPVPIKSPFHYRTVFYVSLETTPKGVIAWSQRGALWRFEKNAWKKLAYKGPKLGRPWCDGSGMIYDPERDCLWMSGGAKGGIVKYDIKTGVGTKLDVNIPKAAGKWPLWREPVAIPGSNLIMRMRNVKAPDGKYKNLAVDVVEKKYYWVDLPYLSGGKPYVSRRRRPAPDFRINSAMRWDARRKLVWVHNPVSFWVLKFDRKTAKLEEVRD